MCTLCNQIAVWNRLYRCKDGQECADMELIVRDLIGNPASESKIVTTKPFLNPLQTHKSFGSWIFLNLEAGLSKSCLDEIVDARENNEDTRETITQRSNLVETSSGTRLKWYFSSFFVKKIRVSQNAIRISHFRISHFAIAFASHSHSKFAKLSHSHRFRIHILRDRRIRIAFAFKDECEFISLPLAWETISRCLRR